MSKFHEPAGQDQQTQMHLLVAKMEGDIAKAMDISLPSAVIGIQQMTASHLAMLDRNTAATLLRETARLLAQEIDEVEFQRKMGPLFDVLVAEYERKYETDGGLDKS